MLLPPSLSPPDPVDSGCHRPQKRPKPLVFPAAAGFHPMRKPAHHALGVAHRTHAGRLHPLLRQPLPIVPDASRHRLDPADHGSHLLLFRFVLQRADRAVQLHEKPLFVLFRQLLPHLPPTRMAGQTLTQLPRHMKSIQLKARPLPKILPAGRDPRRRVAVDDQKVPARIIGIFVHQPLFKPFPHVSLPFMEVVAPVHELKLRTVSFPSLVNRQDFLFFRPFPFPLAGNEQPIRLHKQHSAVPFGNRVVQRDRGLQHQLANRLVA
ncbi:hypothetical protein B23_0034 [Geobacillus thermoleovorans B23]|nr:hypothetical protein B23_0034 [Geobacillus thermoleovorans B23]